jgi:hypothetical protein
MIAIAARRLLVALFDCALLLAPAAAQDHQRALIPGAVDPNVTQRTIRDTICRRGYTAKVRPPRKLTDAIKRRLAERLPDSPEDYELDHLMPTGARRSSHVARKPLAPELAGGGTQGPGRTAAASGGLRWPDDVGAGATRHAEDLGPR